jgi:hypothetical protein
MYPVNREQLRLRGLIEYLADLQSLLKPACRDLCLLSFRSRLSRAEINPEIKESLIDSRDERRDRKDAVGMDVAGGVVGWIDPI